MIDLTAYQTRCDNVNAVLASVRQGDATLFINRNNGAICDFVVGANNEVLMQSNNRTFPMNLLYANLTGTAIVYGLARLLHQHIVDGIPVNFGYGFGLSNANEVKCTGVLNGVFA